MISKHPPVTFWEEIATDRNIRWDFDKAMCAQVREFPTLAMTGGMLVRDFH